MAGFNQTSGLCSRQRSLPPLRAPVRLHSEVAALACRACLNIPVFGLGKHFCHLVAVVSHPRGEGSVARLPEDTRR